MERMKLNAGIVNYPMPVAILGTELNGKRNFLTVSWFSMVSSAPPRIAVMLGKKNMSNNVIKENRSFSICFPSKKHIEVTDYAGITEGEEVDKSDLFKVFYGEIKGAPMIEEFLMNVECKLYDVIESGENEIFIGDVLGIYADKGVVYNETVDIARLEPLILAHTTRQYRALGEKLGNAWSIGREYKK